MHQDVPAGKRIQFKFILKGLSGDISWQPGPDRSLQTWETTKTIVISEDWDNAGCQKVTEEHRGVLVLVDEPQSPELNFGGNNGALEDQTSAPDSAPIPVSGNALDPSLVADVLDAPSKSVEAEHYNSPQVNVRHDVALHFAFLSQLFQAVDAAFPIFLKSNRSMCPFLCK